jgi:hypothetical protein
MEESFIPELMVPGHYMLCPFDNTSEPLKKGVVKIDCPTCGRRCMVDLKHVNMQKGKNLTVRCIHCLDPYHTPTPNNPTKR